MLKLVRISLFKQASRSSLAARAIARPSALFSTAPARRNDFKMPDLSEEQVKELVNNPLVAKLAKSPRTLEALKETTVLMAERGYSGAPGLMKQVQLMMDKEVKDKMLELKKIMDEEGIELKQEDMAGLFKVMGLENLKQ